MCSFLCYGALPDHMCTFVLSFIQLGRTPLIWAARKGKSDVVRELAQRGADVNAQDEVRWLRGCSGQWRR